MNKQLKTNPCQWSRFLDFAEKNPVVLTKKMEGPFGREKYNKLWTELTSSLNSMGYIVKTTEKWQKAVADWKGKVRTKAAEIKIELKKTGGGSPAGKQLSETEKRLIGIMGWTSIRGDGTLELGCPSTSTIPEQIPETQIEFEHNYDFKTMPPSQRNVYIPPPPLIGISSSSYINMDKSIVSETAKYGPNSTSTPQHSPVDNENIPMPVEVKNSRKRKLPIKKKTFISQKRSNTVNLENMHNETLGILGEINSNLKRLGDSQEELCGIHNKILDVLLHTK
ncbi:unnamed protein product [Phaedon cochleariae]|uniref:Regulatory protein zeste n=1 Tax=Phaedon cochleariae TaxID=80249 RepID=A0A9N9SL22_PHACE|nr:unnamed protein product [Phaedon cochleariae]CAG9822144.1 unnamed protein product [Phaedon cochleariae]CAG9822173.1 unnamed protein product [Phaedon cochleariae]CAH1116542.1 unnamed protein product [Phaedon cochleariae]